MTARSLTTVILFLALCVAHAAAGCGSVQTSFPPGITPEAATRIEWPTTPEQRLEMSHDEDEEGAIWVHARGYIDAPIEDVARALQQGESMVDKRVADEWSIEWDVEQGYTVSARVKQVLHRLITVEFFVTWRHGERVDGNGRLMEYAAVYQKTDGSTLVEKLSGSLLARRISADQTSIEIVAHMKAYQYTSGMLAWSIDGMYEDILETIKTLPPPQAKGAPPASEEGAAPCEGEDCEESTPAPPTEPEPEPG